MYGDGYTLPTLRGFHTTATGRRVRLVSVQRRVYESEIDGRAFVLAATGRDTVCIPVNAVTA